jgi:bifunctional non-homologous end joining protein LigD
MLLLDALRDLGARSGPWRSFRKDRLPEGPNWRYELKLDGYCAICAIEVKSADGVDLWSRNENRFRGRYPAVAKALTKLPAHTVIDGEIVALDQYGRPSFNAFQNPKSMNTPKVFTRSTSSSCWAEIFAVNRSNAKAFARRTCTAAVRRADPGCSGVGRALPELTEAVRGQRLETACREAPRQPLRSGRMFRRLDGNAGQ